MILKKPIYLHLMPYLPSAVKKQEIEKDVQLLTIYA